MRGDIVSLPTISAPVTYGDTGLELPEEIGYDEWSVVGAQLARMAESVMWWLGDWWRFGERRYGEAAEEAAPTGYSAETLRKAAWVCERIETVRRRTDLSWSHHDAVARLEPSDQETLLAKAVANAWSTRELRQGARSLKLTSGIRATGSLAEPAIGTYRTVVIDPPWRYENRATRGAAEDHYPTMSLDELATLSIPAADDAHLYLWATNAFLATALDLLGTWGFEYRTCLTWVKPQLGLGNYFRNTTEHALFATRGQLAMLRHDARTDFTANRGRHSAKPSTFYGLVESCSPGPYLDMFARTQRLGWDAWGNEVGT